MHSLVPIVVSGIVCPCVTDIPILFSSERNSVHDCMERYKLVSVYILTRSPTTCMSLRLSASRPLWPNGYGTAFLRRGLRVRVPSEVSFIFLPVLFFLSRYLLAITFDSLQMSARTRTVDNFALGQECLSMKPMR